MKLEDEILAMENELKPVEAEFRYWEEKRKSLDERIDQDFRMICEEDTGARGRGYQLKPAIECRYYKDEANSIDAQLKRWRREYKDGLEEIAEAERERRHHERKYEALLARYGASLDRAKVPSHSGVSERSKPWKASAPDMVWKGLPAKEIAICAGPGGVGKSQLMMQKSMETCCGRNGKKGSVMYAFTEDGEGVVDERFERILDHYCPAFSEDERADIRANFHRFYMGDMSVDLTDSESKNTRAFIRMLKRWAIQCRKRGVPARAIVLDTLANFTAGKENQPESMAALLETLKRICADTGAAIILVHHTAKAFRNGGEATAEDLRGHSLLAYKSRWVNILSPMTKAEAEARGIDPAKRKAFVKSELPKANNLPPQEPVWLMWTEHGILVSVNFGASSEELEADAVPAEALTVASIVPAEPEADAFIAAGPANPEITELDAGFFNYDGGEADHG